MQRKITLYTYSGLEERVWTKKGIKLSSKLKNIYF
jgi:hypothetical protein